MASLVLEDGTTFTGLLFGAEVSVSGEVGESRTHVPDSLVAGSARLRTHLGSLLVVSLCCFVLHWLLFVALCGVMAIEAPKPPRFHSGNVVSCWR